ncbi:L,D-transpeptidase-like protein [Kerstersia gyiorum]|uniref:L,D-transpeptidase-like protein n=1 Tax=Kerstersia gyiorum TaxID=206506 RepID=A0A4Q7MMC2_9BURK|nr:L,D-transpeptidase [Kerstersia gyiorum]KAB0544402.1 L,D-transpeptidase [Kerstersia gyiorum]RZS69524.1 L,D-transpeptidase-like protein [Kerstersia gyiorum]
MIAAFTPPLPTSPSWSPSVATALPSINTGEARFVHVDIANQLLRYVEKGKVVCTYPVSTGARGGGCEFGSYKTPIGLHRIKMKIGDGQPVGTVFFSRRVTGEIYPKEIHDATPDRDWILTRILWLDGLERNRNRSGNVDTLRRYIYIHGTPDEGMLRPPSSHGCIRMYNTDIVELFSLVSVGTQVLIDTDMTILHERDLA